MSNTVNYFTTRDFKPLASVIDIRTVPAGSDAFGELITGELKLSGQCL